MNTFTQNQIQRVLDSFSVGTLRSFELLEKEISFKRKTKLSAQALKAQPFLAMTYAAKVPRWFEKYNDADDWNYQDLAKALAKQNVVWHEEIFEGLAFQVETTHDHYLLFGFSKNGNSVMESDLLSILHKQFEIKVCTLLTTNQNTSATHKFDYHWYLTKPNRKLTQEQVLERLSELKEQQIVIEVGYGGVLFAEIANLEPRKYQPQRVKGSYRLYSDEFWEIRLNNKKVTDRWDDNNADFIEEISKIILKEVSFSNRHKRTHFKLSTGHELIIHRKEELRSWELDSKQHKDSIILLGTGEFMIRDYTLWKDTPIKKRKKSKKDPIGSQFYKEDLPLSPAIVRKLLSQLQGCKVESIDQYSGVSFTMDFSGEWRFSVNCNWRLVDADAKIELDSVKNKFTFTDKLLKLLRNAELKEIQFSDNLRETSLSFTNGYQLILPKEKRYQLWTMFNRPEGYHIDALGDGRLTHIVLVPEELQDQYLYGEKGSKMAHVLYALDLYRKWVQL